MNPIPALSALLLCGAAFAQTTAYFPSDHATIPDGFLGQNWFPYSYGVSRIQAVYESWDITVPAGQQITRIGFRADGNTLAYGEGLQLEILMGQTEKTADDLTNDYAGNWFGSPQTVFPTALYQMPDLNNALNPNPDGPFIWVDLPNPYTFDPSKNLLVEWRVYGNSNGGASFNYRLDRAAFVSNVTAGPVGCAHSGGQVPELASRPTKVGSTWFVDLTKAPGNQPAILFLNVGQPLTPQFSLSNFFPGLPGVCQGQISPIALFSLSGTTNNSGNRTFSVPIPDDLAFNNYLISSQAFCFDFFSPGGFVVSNGDQVEIGVDPAMSVLWSQGNPQAATGSIYRNYGIVTLFEHN